MKNITRTWYHSARSLANCLLLRPTCCLDHHSRRKQLSTSSSSKLCDKLVVVAPIRLTRFSQRPPTLHTVGGGKSYTLKRRGSQPLLQRRRKRLGCPSESADQVPSMTRTSCAQIFNSKRICKPYNCLPFTTGFHEATDSTAVISSGWKVDSLLTQLGSANHRQMFDRDSQRLSNSLCGPPSTGMQAKCSSYILLRATLSDSRRGESFVAKGCSPSLQPSTSREFLLDSLSGAQERRSNEVCDKLEKAKRVGNTPALQNGGHEYPKRTVEDKQLDGKDRSQGCILHHPDASHSPTFSKVYGKSTALPVYMPPIQPVLCSMGLHKSYETHINLPSKYGVRMIVYIDEILVMGESPEQVKGHLEALTYLLTGLGFVINIPKSITTPAQ